MESKILKKTKNKKGIFIIEAVIAILIFMIGILGIIKYQGETILATSQSQYRVTASFLADSILGDMWLKKNQLATFGTSTEYDNWVTQVSQYLPGVSVDNGSTTKPEVNVTTSANGITNVIITLKWQAPGAGVSTYIVRSTIY